MPTLTNVGPRCRDDGHRWEGGEKCADCGASRCGGFLDSPWRAETARCHMAAVWQGTLCWVHKGMRGLPNWEGNPGPRTMNRYR